jgi:hypothetical protein
MIRTSSPVSIAVLTSITATRATVSATAPTTTRGGAASDRYW